jgi:2-polyprenyl-6-methoxyphenol hydroxylase-like FAD-dependent oxidoreductase
VRNFHARRNVTSIVPSRDGAAAILDDGTRFEGDLLIGADGNALRRAPRAFSDGRAALR